MRKINNPSNNIPLLLKHDLALVLVQFRTIGRFVDFGLIETIA